MHEPDYEKIAQAIGRNLRDQYAVMLKEPLPPQLMQLLERLAGRSHDALLEVFRISKP